MTAPAAVASCADHVRFQVSLTRLTRALEFAAAELDYKPEKDVESVVRSVLGPDPIGGMDAAAST